MSHPTARRCAVHPGRPAADDCPSCGRPRCGADAAGRDDCLACRTAARAVTAPPTVLEALVRGGLAAYVAALLGGIVNSQYVGARLFSVVTPLLVGVGCGAAALFVARPADGRARTAVRLAAVVLAVVGAAYGFRLVPGRESPVSPAGRVLPPYVAAAAGAWLWTTPPRRRVAQRETRAK